MQNYSLNVYCIKILTHHNTESMELFPNEMVNGY